MGKTNLTFRDHVQHARENEWSAYRRALRRPAQERFDELWDAAEVHSMAGGALNPADVERALWMSMLLVQQRELDKLRERVEELEAE